MTTVDSKTQAQTMRKRLSNLQTLESKLADDRLKKCVRNTINYFEPIYKNNAIPDRDINCDINELMKFQNNIIIISHGK